jgi:hypothetical protein
MSRLVVPASFWFDLAACAGAIDWAVQRSSNQPQPNISVTYK